MSRHGIEQNNFVVLFVVATDVISFLNDKTLFLVDDNRAVENTKGVLG